MSILKEQTDVNETPVIEEYLLRYHMLDQRPRRILLVKRDALQAPGPPPKQRFLCKTRIPLLSEMVKSKKI